MATVTGLTADRMLAIEAASVVDGDVVGDNLILTKHDGSQINAGSVRGPAGPQGPVGQDLAVLSAVPVLDLGLINQIRAGRQLSAADFANVGLSAPLGLWNLSNNLTDASGNGRNLINKGGVTFAPGILGGANNAAQFTGSAVQALYIPDAGVADPLRLKTGSWGCWLKCDKKATGQYVMSKIGSGGTNAVAAYAIFVSSSSAPAATACDGTTAVTATPTQSCDVADDRWHFVVATMDGTSLKLYVDGNLESQAYGTVILNQTSAAPFNLGGYGADAGINSVVPYYGRVDEAFITADVLSEDQIRNLYCVRIPHALGGVPSRATINVRRRRRGAAFVSGDFSQPPLRLYNFSAGALIDEGSNAVNLANQGGALSVAGPDGTAGNAYGVAATNLSATDAGLPGALAPRSYGCWVKASMTGVGMVVAYGGALNSADTRIGLANGQVSSNNGADGFLGPYICDGQWHFVVNVEDNAAVNGVKRKLYMDGRLVGSSSVMNAITLTGANRLRIGCDQAGTNPFYGDVDSVFICGYAMTAEEISRLYAKGTQTLALSPKNAGDHIEAMTATDILATFDSLDNVAQVDLLVAL